MAGPLSDRFNLPPEWQVFSPLIKDIGDEDSPVDAARVMERIIPVFRAYEEATRPRHYRIKPDNKKIAPEDNPHYFVLSRGLNERGSYGHRIIYVSTDQQLDIMDIDRLLDSAEIFKRSALSFNSKKLEALAKNYEARLVTTLNKGLPNIRRALKSAGEWVSDASFLFDPAPFHDFSQTHERVADLMMDALGELTGEHGKMYDYVRTRLLASLKSFEQSRAHETTALISQARGLLDENASEILTRNPSTRTTGHYHWLTRDKSPDRLVLRRRMADACPIFLLTDNYAKAFQSAENGRRGQFDLDDTIVRLLNIPHTRIDFYRSLREETIGADNARYLPQITRYVEYEGRSRLPLDTPEDWRYAERLARESNDYGRLLDRSPYKIFKILSGTRRERDETDSDALHDMNIHDMRILRDRFVTWGLVPRIVNEAVLRDLKIPVSHALFMASDYDLVDRNLVANTLNKKQREAVLAFNGASRLINRVLESASIINFQESARYYGTHHGEVDQQLRELIITNRLAEHGADYPWEGLPIIEIEDEHYTVIPRNSQADLLKDGLACGHELWRQAPRAIIDGIHFVSLRRRGGITDATAILHEPDEGDPHWRIGDIYPSDSGRKFRNDFSRVFDAYLNSPEFLDTVDLTQIRDTRRRLYSTLSSRAQGHERLGLSDMGDIEERKLKLSILARFWPGRDGFEIDEFGCITSPVIDAEINRLMEAIAPYYPRNTAERRPLPPLG